MADEIRVLVVDDEPIVAMSAERVLNAEGCRAESALGGKEAMLKIEQNHYDLVFTDLRMPGIDGITLIRWLKEFRPSTGVVVITGYPSQESLREARQLGIIDFVPKPVKPRLLKEVAHMATERMRKVKPPESPKEKFSPEALAKLDEAIQHFREKPGSTIPALQRAQEIVGYLPPAIQKRIALGLNIPYAEIHGIVSFYSFFTMKPRGDHTIRVCRGTACYVKGIETILGKIKEALQIDLGETTEDRKFTLEAVRCVGACGLAPVMVVNQDTHGALTQRKALETLNSYSPISISVPAAEEEATAETEV